MTSGAVNSAIGSAIGEVTQILDLSSQITNKISIITESNFVKCGNVYTLNFRLTGSYNITDGMLIMKLPIGPMTNGAIMIPRDSAPPVVFTLDYSGNVRMWWLSGLQTVDYFATITFISH